MNSIWFISDTHFGHQNILEYEPEARPFSCLEKMHEAMIERWNSVVLPNDTVYHLGDFAFGRHNIAKARLLNGKKRLVMGNHDTYPTSEYLPYFDKLYGVLFWERCILSHVPVHSNGLGQRWLLNVHGHLHSRKVKESNWDKDCEACLSYYHNNENIKEDRNYFNVSCEQNNLTPIHADIIRDRLRELS